jgi:putative PEP-CTERM system TPR-repeat lipoprotein
LLGTALLSAGDAAGAEIELRRAQELNAASALVEPPRARAMLALGQFKAVKEQFAELELKDAPAFADLQATVALACSALGETEAAEAAIQRALRAAPDSFAARLAQARIRAAGGDIDAALGLLGDLLARPGVEAGAWRLKGDLLFFSKNDTPAAIVAYRQALAVDAKDAASHAALINAHLAQGDLKSAGTQFAALKAARPGHSMTRYYEAQMAYARHDWVLARDLLQDLLRTAPNDVTLLNVAGLTELELDSLAQAEAYLGKAVQVQPGFQVVRRNLARVLLRTDAPARALAVLAPVLGAADAETLTVAAQAYLRVGDRPSADAVFAKLDALASPVPAVRVGLALSRLARGDTQTAFDELQAVAAADTGGVVADLALIRARISRNELDAALAAIDQLERKQPDNAQAAELRGRVYVLRKDLAAARRSFEQAVVRNARYTPAISSLAGLDLLENKPEAALARFRALLKADPKNIDGLMAVAELRQRAGAQREEVTALIAQAIQANPQHTRPHRALIELQLAARDLPAALSAAQNAVAALPTNVELRDELARILLMSGDAHQAGATFSALVAQSPDSYRGHLGLAEMALAKGDLETAARSGKRAFELAPRVPEVQRLWVALALRQNRAQDALATTRAMQQQRPADAMGYVFEAEVLGGLGQRDAAIAALRKAAALPEPSQAPAMLYAALAQARRPAEAAKFADEWTRQHPQDMAFQLSLGHAALAQGDLAQAEQRFAAVLERQPDNAVALNNAARVLIARHKPGAVALAERALKAAPRHPQLLDTLALALASEQQFAKAVEVQKKLIADAPNTPMYRLTLAKIYLQSGAKDMARDELASMLRPGTDFPGRAEAVALSKGLGTF